MECSPWNGPARPESMAWHPERAEIVIGFKSGELICAVFALGQKKEIKLSTTHQSTICSISWPSDNQMISLDKVDLTNDICILFN